ncbi:MAG: FlgD immunoglobulin-like domain containing protein [bacterium]
MFFSPLIAISFLIENIFAQFGEWKTFTSVGVIQDIDIGLGSVWSGSNGGVLQLDIHREELNKFTNTEGLTTNEVVAVEIDKHGTIWFALFDGVLDRYWPENQKWEVVEDYKNQTITDVVAFGDSLYIGLDIGVSLYTIDKREVKETYKNLGLSSGGNLEKIGANSIFLSGKEIWVATEKGIAQSSLTLPNLQAPSSWTKHTTSQGLPSNQVRQIVVLDSIPYAATKSGVARNKNGQWETINVGLPSKDIIAIDLLAKNEFISQSSIVILINSGIYWLNPSDQWQRLGPSFGDITALKTDKDGNIWIGRQDKGLSKYVFENNAWKLFETNSPASNNFHGLALDSKGRLWCASQKQGIHMLDGDVWTNLSKATGLKSNDQRTILVDSDDRVWAGSWGGGITIIEDSADGFAITKIDTTDGLLAGSDTPAFVVIPHLTMDTFGNIWILNFLADNTKALVVYNPEGNWAHFSTNEGLGTNRVLTAEIDRFNRVWIGTEANGIKVLDHNNTIFDKSDDDFTQGLNINDGLVDNKITAIAEDKAIAEDTDGFVWIGTEEGLNVWFQGIVEQRFGLISNFINTIGVDARNNKWFGTAAGVSVLSNDGVTWTHFTTGNSPLVSNNVISFVFNTESGEVWIGTTNGLSRLKTSFIEPKEDLRLLTGYPNPFIIDGSGNNFIIKNLAENTNIRIYNVAGSIVKTFKAEQIPGAQVVWDGRDDNGNFVPSGIYVYLANTENGLSASGKVAVIQK